MTRHLPSAAGLAGVLLLLLAAALVRPAPAAAQDTKSSTPFTGLVVNTETLSEQKISMVKRLGVRQVRLPVVAERMGSKQKWDDLRGHVKLLNREGIRVVPMLDMQNPEVDGFANLVETALMRLGDQVNAVLLLNRVNTRSGIDRKFLVRAVRESKLVRDVVAPDVKLILGGVLERDRNWLQSFSETSVLNRVDGVGFALFPPVNGVERTVEEDINNPDDLGGFAELVPRLKERGLEVWLTGFGKNTGPPRFGANQAMQASTLARGLLLAKTVGFDRAFIYSGWDTSNNPSQVEDNMGLISYDGSPKMSFEFLTGLVPRLDRMEAIRTPDEAGLKFSPDFPGSNARVWWVMLRDGEHVYLYYWNDMMGMTDLTTGLLINNWAVETVSGTNGYFMRQADFSQSSNDQVTVLEGLPISMVPSRLHLRIREGTRTTAATGDEAASAG